MIKLFLVSKRRAKIIEILKINLLICFKNTYSILRIILKIYKLYAILNSFKLIPNLINF